MDLRFDRVDPPQLHHQKIKPLLTQRLFYFLKPDFLIRSSVTQLCADVPVSLKTFHLWLPFCLG